MRFLSLLPFTLVAAVSFAAESLHYSPVNEGMEWTMDATATMPDGRTVKTVMRRRIEAKEERGGKTYYPMRSWMVGQEARGRTMLVRRDETGAYIAGPEGGNADHLTLPFPVELGKKWKTHIDGIERNYEVVAVEVQVIEEKRYDNCAKIRVTRANGDVVEELWEAPGIGCVRSELSLPDGTKVSVTLSEFKPGKK